MRQAVEAARVETGDVGPAAGDQVNGVLVAQPSDLLRAQSGIGKHPALRADMGEALGQAVRRQGFDQADAQAGDARAHAFDLFLPESLQLAVAEDRRDHLGAMRRRGRPEVAGEEGQLATQVGELLGVLRADDQRADAVAVQAEVLRAGTGDQHLRQFAGEQAYRPGVFLETVAEAW